MSAVNKLWFMRQVPFGGTPGALLPYAAAIRSSVTSRRML